VAEQRYKAVPAVIGDGRTVTEVAAEWRVSRQTVQTRGCAKGRMRPQGSGKYESTRGPKGNPCGPRAGQAGRETTAGRGDWTRRNHQLGLRVTIGDMSWESPAIRAAWPPASARQKWWRGTLLAGLLLTLVGCQASPTAAASVVPRGKVVVVGGIDHCSGLPTTVAKNPGFVAGTVTVWRGRMSYVREPDGVTRYVLPTDKEASQTVAKHQKYRFVLPPGPYVLVGHYPGGNVEPSVAVLVRLGNETRQNIPNECI
jgi:hypothetical protein